MDGIRICASTSAWYVSANLNIARLRLLLSRGVTRRRRVIARSRVDGGNEQKQIASATTSSTRGKIIINVNALLPRASRVALRSLRRVCRGMACQMASSVDIITCNHLTDVVSNGEEASASISRISIIISRIVFVCRSPSSHLCRASRNAVWA